MSGPSLYVLVGVTGAGKSAVALALGAAHPIEIVSLDSVQVYRGLDIGSAKPSLEERGRLPHHLLDLVEPDARFSTADWLLACERALDDIRARGRIPLLVGGTGLYLRALTTGLAPLPPADDALRARLTAEEAGAPGVLHARLRELDPESAERLAPRDLVRVVRALEVQTLTGRSLSAHHAAHAAARGERALSVFVLDPPEPVLRTALVRRTEQMLAQGLVEEATALRARWGAVRPLDSVGYKEALERVDGRLPPGELAERIVLASRQFARRQRTWWRKLAGARSFEAPGPLSEALGVALGGAP